MKYLILCFTVALSLGCNKSTSVEEQFDADIKIIEDYIAANSLNASKTVDGIYYVIDVPGGAEKPKITSEVTVTYRGYFTDGVSFDSATKAKFPLYGVIQGWQIGIPKFGKGGKGKLLIPSKYGYGTSPVGGRTSAVLIFDVELVDF